MENIDSLEKLIQRLKDPEGEPVLRLTQSDLGSIARYEGIHDFASVYCEFLTAIKANTTITELEFQRNGYDDFESGCGSIPILNPLFRHLPYANAACIELQRDPLSSYGALKEFTRSFCTIRVKDRTQFHDDDDSDPFRDRDLLEDFDFDPDLEVFHYDNESMAPEAGAIGSVVLTLPFPSKLVDLRLSMEDSDWDEVESNFSTPQLERLANIVQAPSLRKLCLKGLHFSTKNACRRFARGLAASSVQDLSLELYTPSSDNYRPIVSALVQMPDLQRLNLAVWLDGSSGGATTNLYSIPIGAIVRGSPSLSTLTFCQTWKLLDSSQCQDLAQAIQAPSCCLKTLSLVQMAMIDLGTVMSSLSAPPSSIEGFAASLAPSGEEDVDAWLSLLPTRTSLRLCAISVPFGGPVLTESQRQKFLEIVSGWYCLEEMHEEWLNLCLDEDCRTQLRTLCRLNKAGRRYLISPTRSHASGVEVLVEVRDHLNDLYSHILENPSLCDRQAVQVLGVGAPAFVLPSGDADQEDDESTEDSDDASDEQSLEMTRLFAETKELIDAKDDEVSEE